MKSLVRLLVLFGLSCAAGWAQTPPGAYGPSTGGSTGGGGNALINNLPDTAHLLFDYQFNVGDTVASEPDSSGNGNACTSATGSPTIVAITGGVSLSASSAQSVVCPAQASVRTIQVTFSYQPSTNTNNYNCPILSGAPSSTTNSSMLCFYQNLLNDAWGNNSNAGPSIRTSAPQVNTFNTSTQAGPIGTMTVTWLMDTNDRIFVNGKEIPIYGQQGASAGVGTNVWRIGGAAAGTGNTNQTYFTGTVYRIVGWSAVESAANIAQAAQQTQTTYQARGVTFSTGATDRLDAGISEGDSITQAALFGFTPQLLPNGGMANMVPNSNGFLLADNSIGGTVSGTLANRIPLEVAPFIRANGGRQFGIVEVVTNNSPGGLTAMQAAAGDNRNGCTLIHSYGAKCIVVSMISRSGEDANWKNLVNPIFRTCLGQGWCDALADVGGDSGLGCDGCNTNGNFNADNIHLVNAGNLIYGTEVQRAVNRAFGNTNATTANTYTSTYATNIPPTHVVDQNAGGVTTFGNSGFFSPYATSGAVGHLTTGNFLFCVDHWNGAAVTATTPTDTLANTFVGGTQIDNGNSHTKPFWVFNLTGGQNDTITFAYSGAATQVAISCTEYADQVDTLDLQNTGATGSSTSPAPGGITTTKGSDLVISFEGMDGQPSSVSMAGGFTIRQQNTSNIAQALQGDQLNKAAGTYTATFTLGTSEVWEAGSIAFYRNAATVQLRDEDTFVNGGVLTAAETAILPPCMGATGSRYTFNNQNTAAFVWTLQGNGSDVIGDGTATTLATVNGQTVTLESVLTSQSSPACHWKIIQLPASLAATYNSGSISASVTSTNIAAAANFPTGQYLMNCDVVVTAVGASPTLAVTVGWTDISGTARTKTCTTGVVAVSDNPTTQVITSNGSAAITVTQTLAVSTATWQTTIGLTKLQ